MPRYFFHRGKRRKPSRPDGVELPGLIEAREQAACLAGAVLHECAGQFWDGQPWSVRVTDRMALPCFR